ncbi:PREDICTED: pentatricopeptide repeat-containing protein At2g36980, mitochondrial [Nelumbo nucifera]|uniref:Pentatricopeptide repeat-containing protein At2g36980, mitochondrial n=2 Tax=Nelumbo nucifera TaxID=4432 RepID=A0A822YPG3_NELNU|nr:PREDICTED: pentatricopeptide repeat-containing protein At2g36980, mitochondrial [Nelumbo nucifera]DAD33471.1 TPA_asm: hypothetical protein HUJ06_012322 [Nelumbo nucifera]
MCSDLFRVTSEIVSLARSGRITYARKLFDGKLKKDLIAWNAMLTSYSQLGLFQDAWSLFSDMRVADIRPDGFTFTTALSASADVGNLRCGRKIHALVVSFGYSSSLPVSNSLIDMYGKCSSPFNANKVFEEMSRKNVVSWCSLLFAFVKCSQFDRAREVFDKMPSRSEVAWNMLMAGYARAGDIQLSMVLFKEMQEAACEPDLWTFTTLMNACAELPQSCYGRMMHGFILKSGWISSVEANNSVLSFYAKVSCQDDAFKVFESIDARTQVSWNAMIDALMKVGDVNEALAIFRKSPEKNVISWTTMITGYARIGDGIRALSFFIDMTRSLTQPDNFAFGAVLHACSNLAILGYGRMIHGCVIRHGFHSFIYVGNGLVNMYAKCGDIDGSLQVFNGIANKDLVSWNAMLFGFGLHGLAIEALRVYEDMVASGLRPDKVTFIGLLMACSHSGLIAQGQVLFESMRSVYGLPHEVDHIACIVDMLGRGGYLKEARKLVEECSRTANMKNSSLEALFGACAAKGDVGLGEKVGIDLMMMEPQKELGYVLLSNLYCANGQWKEAENVRKVMMEHGVKKLPGCSWIEVRNRINIFVAGKNPHPHMEEVCNIINFLEYEMRNPSFIGFENYKDFMF